MALQGRFRDFSSQILAEDGAEWIHSVKFEPKFWDGKDQIFPPNAFPNPFLGCQNSKNSL